MVSGSVPPNIGLVLFGLVCAALTGRNRVILLPMKLYNYFRSSASFRVRIALGLKGLPYEYISVHIAKGEHKKPEYASLAADTLVPLLDMGADKLSQSMAIIEYLDETHPTPALLPSDALGRARVRALSQSIACEIHPLNNLRVLKYLVKELKLDENAKNAWYRHWVRDGLVSFEKQLAQLPPAKFCYGDSPTLADCCRKSSTANALTATSADCPAPWRRLMRVCS
jgi:maleylacetoacetate isomerase